MRNYVRFFFQQYWPGPFGSRLLSVGSGDWTYRQLSLSETERRACCAVDLFRAVNLVCHLQLWLIRHMLAWLLVRLRCLVHLRQTQMSICSIYNKRRFMHSIIQATYKRRGSCNTGKRYAPAKLRPLPWQARPSQVGPPAPSRRPLRRRSRPHRLESKHLPHPQDLRQIIMVAWSEVVVLLHSSLLLQRRVRRRQEEKDIAGPAAPDPADAVVQNHQTLSTQMKRRFHAALARDFSPLRPPSKDIQRT